MDVSNLRSSLYHKILRVALVVCAFVLLFESGLVHQSTKGLSLQAHQYVANAIGMSARIEPTELNQLTADLTAQRIALQQREDALREREIAVELQGGTTNTSVTYVLAGVLFVLLVLIIINYTLDFIRAKEVSRLREQTV